MRSVSSSTSTVLLVVSCTKFPYDCLSLACHVFCVSNLIGIKRNYGNPVYTFLLHIQCTGGRCLYVDLEDHGMDAL